MKLPARYNTVFKLKFEDPELDKLNVRLKQSYGLADSAANLVTIDLDSVRSGRAKPEDLAQLRQLVRDFSGALISWDLEDDAGEPVGTDEHSVRGQDMVFVLTLISSFLDALNEAARAARVDPMSLNVQVDR